jgi:fructokinase
VQPPTVTVADTVGAGDALAAGLLTGLLESGVTSRSALDAVSDEDLTGLVTTASRVAALTCTRKGAQPPTRAELDAWTADQAS